MGKRATTSTSRLSSFLNIKGERNKYEFVKSTSTPDAMPKKIALEIEIQGFGVFTMEVLEILHINPEMTESEIKDDLKLLEEIWRGKLGKENEY